MPRLARIYLGEGIFHILTRGNNKQIVFHDKKDFQAYKEILQEIKKEQPYKLYHYCLMDNHVHLIIETNRDTELSKLMKRINLKYYNHYKRRYGYCGHFWQDRFKSLLIDRDEYLLACGLYIERNPVRAKIAKTAEEYKYTSYKVYAYGEKDGVTEEDPFYTEIGKSEKQRQQAYRQLFLDTEKGLTGKIFNQLYLGNDEFVTKMEKQFGVLNTHFQRGRPNKKGTVL